MSTKNIIFSIIGVIAIGILLFWWWSYANQPGKLDDFAKCLSDKGAKFYGAFWCSHCQSQKTLFGSSKRYLPYVECSTPDSNSQLSVCIQEHIKAYPTWKFADESVLEGELTLQQLSEKSGCSLP